MSIRSSSVDTTISIATFIFLALLAALAAYRPSAPAAAPADVPLTDFSSARAMRHLERIARTPHPIGSAEHSKVRECIQGELNRLGLSVEVQNTTVFSQVRNGYLTTATVNNIVGVLKGYDNSRAVMLVAHYDSVATGPGASDNGAGVAAALEVVNAVKAGPPLKNNLIVLLTDGEEAGLLGAKGFIDEHPMAKEVGLVLNFEARGNHGPSILFETSNENGQLIKEFASAAPYPVASSLFYELYKALPNDTDLSVFKMAGLAGFNFAYINGSSYYHTALDNLENVDNRSLQHHGSYGLALARHFGGLNMIGVKGGEVVYFDIMGSTLVRYSTAWVIPITILLALSYVCLLFLGVKRKRLTFSGLAAGALLMLLSMIGAPLLFFVIWRLICAIHPDYRLFTVGDIYNSHYYGIGFIALSAALSAILFIWFRKKFSVVALALGGLCWWVILMVLTSLYFPGGSYLFTWPLVFALVALGVNLISSHQSEMSVKQAALYVLCAIPGIILGVPVVRLAFIGLTLKSYEIVLVFVALLWGLLLPLVNIMARTKAWWLPGVLSGLGAILIVAGSLTSGFDQKHPKPNNVFYGLNSDNGKAVWASLDEKPDEWTSQFFASSAERGVLSEYFAFSSRKYLQAPAIAAPVAGPVVELLSDSVNDGLRTLHLQIMSPRLAPIMVVHLENQGVIDAVINGKRVERRLMTPPEAKRWGLRYYGLPSGGMDMVLTVRSTEPLKVRCVDQSYGLPQFPNIPFKQRPDYMIAPSPVSDTVMVSKFYTF